MCAILQMVYIPTIMWPYIYLIDTLPCMHFPKLCMNIVEKKRRRRTTIDLRRRPLRHVFILISHSIFPACHAAYPPSPPPPFLQKARNDASETLRTLQARHELSPGAPQGQGRGIILIADSSFVHRSGQALTQVGCIFARCYIFPAPPSRVCTFSHLSLGAIFIILTQHTFHVDVTLLSSVSCGGVILVLYSVLILFYTL